MRLNASEKQAFKALQKIIDFYTNEKLEKQEVLELTTKEYRLIKKVFGIDLKEITHKKKAVKTFAKGKDTKHIEFLNPFAPSSYENSIRMHGYFPFQIKELNEQKVVK